MTHLAAFALLLLGADDACQGIAPQLATASQDLIDNKPDTAEQLLSPLRNLSAECPQIGLLLGRTRAAQGMPALALNLITEYTQRVPSDAAGHVALAELLWQRNDLDGAAKTVAVALRLKPDSSPALLLQAQIFQAQHRSAEAEASFRKVVQLDPTNAPAWDYLALSLESQGEENEAEAAYTAGIKINSAPKFDRFLDYNYGRFLMKQNRLTESEKRLNRAVELSPDTRAVYYERAKLYLLLGKYAESRADAERALHIPDPGQYIQEVQIYSLLAVVYQHLGDTQQAHSFASLARTAKLKGGSGGRQ